MTRSDLNSKHFLENAAIFCLLDSANRNMKKLSRLYPLMPPIYMPAATNNSASCLMPHHATSCHITHPNRTCDWLPSSVGRGRPAILRRGNDGDEREFDGVRHRSRSHYRDRKTGDCAPARGEGRPIAFERDGKPPTVFSRDGGAVDPVPSRRGRRRSCSLAGGRAPIAFPPASDRTDMMHNREEQ